MKNLFFVFLKVFLLITVIIFSPGCPEVFTDDDIDFGSISGIVTDINKIPIANVKVTINNKEIYSDDKGLFSIDKIPIGNDQVVEFSKPNHVNNQKQATIELNKNTLVFASLGTWDKSETINPSQENTVSFQNAEVKLPANGIVDANGNAFTGNVTVKAAYFDPMADNYENVFPGDFEGEDINGNTVDIESFGFINVELKNGTENLNLASGQKSTITIPISDVLIANAPNTIPLWYFDEKNGTWIEEGVATIQNGAYVGTVTHFTPWNCDKPINSSKIKGKVTCKDGTPIEGARVIAKGVDYSGFRQVETASDGSYSIDVKASAKAEIYSLLLSSFGTEIARSQTVTTNTASGEQVKTIEDLLIKCDTISYSRLYDITTDFPYSWDYGKAIAVGESGWIVSYDDENDIWVRQDAGTVESFYGVDCPAWNSLWAVGSNGVIRFSEDLGENWSPVFIQTDADLHDVEFYNAYYGWIVGTTGKIFRTEDAGANWTSETSGTVQTLYDGAFVSKNEGWVCGTSDGTFGTILHTIDGGVSWQPQTSNTFENLKGIEFIDRLNGWAVGENGAIVKTQDGGITWTKQASGTLEDLNGIDFANQRSGKIVGNNGVYLNTDDGGQSWTSSTHTPSNNFEALDYRSRHAWGIAVGDDVFLDLSGFNQETTQGWVLQANEPEKLRDIKSVSETESWAVGDDGKVMHTTNAGSTWIDNASFSNSDTLHTIEIIGDNIWIGGNNNTLYKSEDHGITWVSQLSGSTGKNINKIQFSDDLNGFYMMFDINQNLPSSKINIYKTTNGGQTWNKMSKPASYISDIFFIDENTGWASGHNEIFETNDGGSTWQDFVLDFEGNNSGDGNISVLSNNLIWFTTGSNLYHAEKGKQWYGKFIDFNDDYTLKSLQFLDPQTGWAIDEFINGDIVKTINGGKTWYTQRTGNFESMDMFNINVGWVVGKNGEILYTNTGGD